MTNDNTDATVLQPDADAEERLFDTWFDPIENAVRDQVRSFIEELIEGELEAVLARPRYGRWNRSKHPNIARDCNNLALCFSLHIQF